jgi:hypothetical protein
MISGTFFISDIVYGQAWQRNEVFLNAFSSRILQFLRDSSLRSSNSPRNISAKYFSKKLKNLDIAFSKPDHYISK